MAKPFQPVPPKERRKNNPTVSVRLSADLVERFYTLCATNGLSPNRLADQCIRYALDNMKQ